MRGLLFRLPPIFRLTSFHPVTAMSDINVDQSPRKKANYQTEINLNIQTTPCASVHSQLGRSTFLFPCASNAYIHLAEQDENRTRRYIIQSNDPSIHTAFIHPPLTHQSIYPSICSSKHPFIRVSIPNLSIHSSINLSIHTIHFHRHIRQFLSICQFIYSCIHYLPIHLPINSSVHRMKKAGGEGQKRERVERRGKIGIGKNRNTGKKTEAISVHQFINLFMHP